MENYITHGFFNVVWNLYDNKLVVFIKQANDIFVVIFSDNISLLNSPRELNFKQKLLAFAFWQVAWLEIGMVLFPINWTKSFQMLLQILKKHYPLAFVQSFEGTCKTKSCICNYISGTNFMWMYFSGIDAELIFIHE